MAWIDLMLSIPTLFEIEVELSTGVDYRMDNDSAGEGFEAVSEDFPSSLTHRVSETKL